MCFIENDQCQPLHSHEPMLKCFQENLRRRNYDANVFEDCIPCTLVAPLLDVNSASEILNSKGWETEFK